MVLTQLVLNARKMEPLWVLLAINNVKRPQPNPNKKKIPSKLAPMLPKAQLEKLADFAAYVGSGEHKSAPWHDVKPLARKDANLCPPNLNKNQANAMLKAGILAGNISEDFDGEMPRRVWYRGSMGIYEARLTDRSDMESGKPAGYKGWPETDDKLPSKPRNVGPCNEI